MNYINKNSSSLAMSFQLFGDTIHSIPFCHFMVVESYVQLTPPL